MRPLPDPWTQITLLLLLLLLGGVFFCLTREAHAEQNNGIVVDPPKQFSYRQLEAMIAELQSQLTAVRPVDAAKITGQVGTIQGFQRRQRELALEAKGPGTPGVSTTLGADDDGTLAPTAVQIDDPAVTPTIPATDSAAAAPGALPSYGFSASQILGEQVQLQYELFNLRLLQHRSISDRFITKEDGTEGSRVLALVGVTVTLTPGVEHQKKAAVVEILLRPKNGAARTSRLPSLVALMPDKKTFNSVAHSTKSNAFGGAAMAGVVPIGLAGKWKSEQLYLFQDNDIVAFRGAPETVVRDRRKEESLVFGWQFRPVLGQKLVEPGERHLYAVIALDEIDTKDPKSYPFEVEARTYWRSYHSRIRAPWGRKLWYVNAGPRSIELANSAKLHEGLRPIVKGVKVQSIGGEKLLVKVEAENLHEGARVTIGDQVLAEGTELTHRSGGPLEFIASTRRLLENQVRLVGAEYGFSTLLEIDPVEEMDQHCDEGELREGTEHMKRVPWMEVPFFDVRPRRKGARRDLRVWLAAHRADCSEPGKKAQELPWIGERSVFITLAETVYEVRPGEWKIDTKTGCLYFDLSVPLADVASNTLLKAEIPFFGDAYRSEATYYPSAGVSRIELLETGVQVEGGSGDMARWGIVGWGLAVQAPQQESAAEPAMATGEPGGPVARAPASQEDGKSKLGTCAPDKGEKPPPCLLQGLQIYAGRKYGPSEDGVGLAVIDQELITLTAPMDDLAQVKKVVIVLPGDAEPTVVKAPQMTLPAPKPSVDPAPRRVRQNTASYVVFPGDHLSAVKEVRFDGKRLPFESLSKGEGLKVYLNREVTKHRGEVTLLAGWGDGKTLALNLIIQPPQ